MPCAAAYDGYIYYLTATSHAVGILEWPSLMMTIMLNVSRHVFEVYYSSATTRVHARHLETTTMMIADIQVL